MTHNELGVKERCLTRERNKTQLRPMLQTRRGKRNNLGIIFHITINELFIDNKRGHNIRFHSEIRKIVFELSSINTLIWSSVSHLY